MLLQDWHPQCPHLPSGSQSFFRARHMGALIRRFLPLYLTVVALGNSKRSTEALQPACATPSPVSTLEVEAEPDSTLCSWHLLISSLCYRIKESPGVTEIRPR